MAFKVQKVDKNLEIHLNPNTHVQSLSLGLGRLGAVLVSDCLRGTHAKCTYTKLFWKQAVLGWSVHAG